MKRIYKILIACEESQAICKEFRRLGHEAYSCDILPCSGGHPEWHIQGDAIEEAYSTKYDMMIAHPPCTYLSNAGAPHLWRGKKLNEERYKKGLEGKDFFMKLWNAPIDRIVVENPTPSKIYNLPEYSQVIEPYMFGEPHKKRTCLWIKNLPNLEATNIVQPIPVGYFQSGPKKGKPYFFTDGAKGGKDRAKNRSKTFPGIAKAIAEQYLKYLQDNDNYRNYNNLE